MLDIGITQRGTYHLVRLSGELTADDVSRLSHNIGERIVGPGARLALDLSQLRLIDSAGLSDLIHLVTRARLTEGRVVLVAPSPFVSGILAVTRLDQWFEIVPTQGDAERELGAT